MDEDLLIAGIILILLMAGGFFFLLPRLQNAEQKKKDPPSKTHSSSASSSTPFFSSFLAQSTSNAQNTDDTPKPRPKKNLNFHNLSEFQNEMRKAKITQFAGSFLIGIDYTKSNLWAGSRTFYGKSLHLIQEGLLNPYQQVISLCGKVIEIFSDTSMPINLYGFGDLTTKNFSVFNFFNDAVPYDRKILLAKYQSVTDTINMSGPTNFQPLIEKAIFESQNKKKIVFLLIICDGGVTDQDKERTKSAIVEASKYPVVICVVGVGDGPWDEMYEFESQLPDRRFDNFSFVEFGTMEAFEQTPEQAQNQLVMQIFNSLPQQINAMEKLSLIQ